jgi:hypothetical protein
VVSLSEQVMRLPSDLSAFLKPSAVSPRERQQFQGVIFLLTKSVQYRIGSRAAKLTTKRLADWHRAICERPRRWRAHRSAKPNLAAFDRRDAQRKLVSML